ncbi:MAG: peptide chain release factor 1 [Saprospirales bacterium]|nr:MAG: peptide chain release factor 1 [Saprospirales bacterium]
MIDKLRSIKDRYMVLQERMSDPEVISDQKLFSRIHKEYKDMEAVVQAFDKYQTLDDQLQQAQSLLNEKDADIREMARMEAEELKEDITELTEQIKKLLIPKDPEDTSDALMEIRAGTGGDEASIFAGDLFRMYTAFFDEMGWKYDIISANEGTVGGYSKIVAEVRGEEVFGKLKFESGGHRVQRVPKTETQGRVHTSAATVAVLPKLEEDEIDIRKEDLKVDTFRSSGAGGQHVNKTESGVRLTHLPTGLVVECTDGRSQIKNREIALQRLYQKVKNAKRNEEQSQIAAQRKSLVGSGDRSSKIRTYNFPQNRVTDHRINLTLYNLDQIINGKIGEIIEALQVAENAEKMQEGAAQD